ncbi:type IV secretion system protein [Neisseria sp. Ec49-e6-T10]|uniref:type IV secretion system protein n=1 Tax=Neisseria sp. Ec49-e6-T10 TaxID=3140744 RepID=UPI003EB96340
MKKMQKNFLATVIIGSFLAGPVHASGVPVVDGVHISETVINAIKQGMQWAKEAEQWKSYVDALKSQNYGALLQPLMVTAGALLGAEAGTDDASAKKFLGEDDNSCGLPNGGDYYKTCVKERNIRAERLTEMEKLLKSFDKRQEELTALTKKWSAKMEPGEMQSLQFKISSLQAQIQNDMARMQLSMAMYKQREELMSQKRADAGFKAIYGNGDGKPVDMDKALSALNWD